MGGGDGRTGRHRPLTMPRTSPSIRQVPARRLSPRYLRFVLTGALLGVLVTVVAVVARGASVERPSAVLFYLGILLAGVGALLGGAVAVLLDGRRR